MYPDPLMSRRHFLSALAAVGSLSSRTVLRAEESDATSPPTIRPRYKIGVCDWMILKRQQLGAFQRTAQIGADARYLKSIFQTGSKDASTGNQE